jgi:tetratricopeptide (TPR) repeat protein
MNGRPLQRPVPIASTAELVNYDPRLDVPIYHLHGALFGPRSGIVVTESDYARFRESRRMLFEALKLRFATSTFLYIGYSNRDPSWKLVLDELTQDFFPSKPPASYRVAPDTDSIESEILKSKGIETIAATFEQFAVIASTTVAPSEADPERFSKVRSMVPTQLRDAFDKSPAAVTRLVASWTYVNQAPFTEAANTAAFLQGDRPNWAVVGAKHQFSRDIEEDVYDDVLDYVTGTPKIPSTVLVLGPAGYGITTALMSLASRLVAEKAGPVFMHKPATPLAEGDIVFAASMFDRPPIFVVDDAGDNITALEGAITQLRGNNKPAIFVLGERLNEWRQQRTRLSGTERLIEPLSDAEIDRLLECLARHHALNNLEPLNRELRIAVIKQKHGKELLVTMKEATEGKGFDAILEDEFRGIHNPLAQSLYLTVCCLYQHGAYVRDAVLAQTMEVDLPTLYKQTAETLDGVVVYECIDEAMGLYAARARHRTVAAVVWERCGAMTERDRLLQATLQNLNLNYKPDVNAFEKLVRSERLVDGIRGLENKIKFFETACRKDPDNPYVRQHYGRMLSRENKPELALTQIEEGLKLHGRDTPRVLFHTKGVILTQLVAQTESEGIARRRLVQAEEAFRKSIALNRRDEYGYQGLAKLYLEWAKRASAESEATEYVSKVEEVISEGLRNVKVRDGLWVMTSEVEKWLGDMPSRVKALEQAIVANPGSVIARYLLGRTYRQLGKPDKALLVLDPVVKGNIDEFRAFIEYALALLATGKSLSEAIAVLSISTTYGLSDARFVATLGGLQFMANAFSNAEKTFQESVRREFPYSEIHTIHFRPSIIGATSALKLHGKVTVVRPKYALLEVEGYPTFLCPSSKFGDMQFKVGMKVQFEVEFNAKGPVATKPLLPKLAVNHASA